VIDRHESPLGQLDLEAPFSVGSLVGKKRIEILLDAPPLQRLGLREVGADARALQARIDVRMPDDEDILLAFDDRGCAENVVRVAVITALIGLSVTWRILLLQSRPSSTLSPVSPTITPSLPTMKAELALGSWIIQMLSVTLTVSRRGTKFLACASSAAWLTIEPFSVLPSWTDAPINGARL
jgi:hypothetical protein